MASTAITSLSREALNAWLSQELHVLLRLAQPPCAVSDRLADLGMRSLVAVTLQYRLLAVHGLEADLVPILAGGTIDSLARQLLALPPQAGAPA